MGIVIKRIETEEEIRGKAYVHWKAWQEAYPGMIRQDYLEKMTLEKCEEIAFQWKDGILIAMDGRRVVGFAGYGHRDEIRRKQERSSLCTFCRTITGKALAEVL